jgi:signal transduction histidine kinase
MSGADQLQYLSWLLYLVGFALVLRRTLQRPTPAHVDMTLFFGAVCVIVLVSLFGRTSASVAPWLVGDVAAAALLMLGYLLMRLVGDFSQVPAVLLRGVELGMLVSIAAVVLAPQPLPAVVVVPIVLYLGLVIAYDAWAFTRQATRTTGVTRRRMQAAALASICLALVILTAGLNSAAPNLPGVADISALLGLASGIGYFVAFAPPTWLRRAWQEPEVRAFLARLVRLATVAELPAMIEELERGIADAFGAPLARIALWDDDKRCLHVDGSQVPQSLSRAYTDQRASLIQTDLSGTEAAHAASFGVTDAHAVLSAPISAVGRRLGLLLVFSPRSPVFANSDLELIQLLADQTAVILEARGLIDQAARVRAREEAARLKEDFLSSAAHDLKTPLTGIVTQAQVMKRRAERNPGSPTDMVGLDRLLSQSHRLKDLVLELLDVSRLEQGSLIGTREPANVADVVRDLKKHEPERWKRVQLSTEPNVIADIDVPRFEQVVTNLVENALKYSPQTSAVHVSVRAEAGEARVSVRDQGIGIPAEDQPLIFERFHRARNVDDRRYAGMGLGLYIARGIVEQHGGRIWIDSTPGQGSTFHVAVPGVERESVTGTSAEQVSS